MSLNWDVTKIENFETVCKVTLQHDDPATGRKKGDKAWSPVTQALVWACLHTGIGSITADNWKQFAVRLAALETIAGPFLSDRANPGRRITNDEIRAHIGLGTNVFPQETAAKFEKKLIRFLEAEEKRFAANKRPAKRREKSNADPA